MRNHHIDREIALIARGQHGVFHARQVRELGATPAVLRNRTANGVLVQLAPKVWAVASQPPTWQRQYKAAELSLADSAIADRAAAHVHGFNRAGVVRPSLVVSYEANRRQALARVRRSDDVAVTTVDGIRVTSVAQTLFDVIDRCDLRLVEGWMDGALLTGAVTVDDLIERRDAMERLKRRHIGVWRGLVEERTDVEWAVLDSELEVALRKTLVPLSRAVDVLHQATPPWWPNGRRRVDSYIPRWKLIVEADGRRWHARVADFERDRWRDNIAAANGHRVMRFTHVHLTQRRAEVLELVRAAGRAGTPTSSAA